MNREDFEVLKTGIIYFDNAATTLKPIILSEVTSDYYNYYSANAHRGDYSLSVKVSSEYEKVRSLVKTFIGATNESEIVFTSGCTDSLNKIIFGYFKNYLKKGDEVLITKTEHAANVLPWFELEEQIGIKVKYIPLTEDHKVTMENVEKSITGNTKVISLAHITNVIGDLRPVKQITNYAHKNNILVVVDGAQSIPHIKVDVKDLDVDFFTFSAHKMCGPTGVGVLYGKKELLKDIKPIIFGGGMNTEFDSTSRKNYKNLPERLEGGTPNIAGVIGFGSIIEYLNKIGLNNIHKQEEELREYLIKRLKEIPQVIVYNEQAESGVVIMNYEGIFSQDLAIYLDKYNICVRAGNHCAKMTKEEINVKNTCRISLYFYNTKDEIDKLITVLKNPSIKNELI